MKLVFGDYMKFAVYWEGNDSLIEILTYWGGFFWLGEWINIGLLSGIVPLSPKAPTKGQKKRRRSAYGGGNKATLKEGNTFCKNWDKGL